MSFLSILETIFIGPLKLVFEIIFNLANRAVEHPGIAIIFLSLVMNILVLPLYKRADAMQEQSRDMEAKLEKGVRHIKQTFSGDERMMILQTYYRQNNYKPTNALKGSVSLLLEIPFFMAAYQFLSHLTILDGVSLGPIANLGAPDGLLTIGGISINLLPVLMTVVNIISSSLYLKGFPLKTKIQLYAMALFFLVFLYTSPACLVFYWTLNNVFSLVKNIFYKLKNPKKVICWLCAVCGVAVIGFALSYFGKITNKLFAVMVLAGIGLIFPLVYTLVKKHLPAPTVKATPRPNKNLFVLGGVFLTLLIGVLIPSSYLASSPQEFVDLSLFFHPIWYLVSAAAMAAGFFLVWFRVFYWLANDRGKAIFDKLVWIACGVTLVNYMFFGTDTGVVSSSLYFETSPSFTPAQQLVNLAVLVALAAIMWLLASKWKKLPGTVLLVAILALGCMSGLNTVTIFRSVAQVQGQTASTSQEGFHIDLSKKGQNVLVIMLDRAMGSHVPYIMQERPELKESFSGFTYYANTVSHGSSTNFGSPGLVGGYEYTPVEMNKRAEESLEQKQNEALKVMPRIFSDNGYQVTVCNPPYAGYQWIPDLTIFDDIKNVDAYVATSDPRPKDNAAVQQDINANLRNFFCLGVMEAAPLSLQPHIYHNGTYLQASTTQQNIQFTDDNIVASGLISGFVNPYMVLDSLPDITKVSEGTENNFLFFCNDTPHTPMLLQLPDYVPSHFIDNSKYLDLLEDRVAEDGTVLKMSDYVTISHYHANMATLLKLADWMDYLKEQGVYDNTRIILVSDHGRQLNQIDELIMNTSAGVVDIESYYPLLMVKDFGATGFTTSDTFMTNADVPTLAVTGVIENPVNPYTGKPINSDEKTAHRQYINLSDQKDINYWHVSINNGNCFFASPWASVEGDMRNPDNWEFYNKEIVLDEHAFPED